MRLSDEIQSMAQEKFAAEVCVYRETLHKWAVIARELETKIAELQPPLSQRMREKVSDPMNSNWVRNGINQFADEVEALEKRLAELEKP